MITLLKIHNLALVEDLAWDIGAGLVGITGETGAGKSVIVGALKLVLGERADRGLVRTGCDSCSVEAVFDLERPEEVNAVLVEAGLEPCEDNQLVVRRVIGGVKDGAGKGAGKSAGKAGANKQFINCSPVTLGVLKQLGRFLVDLHGPHDHQSLLSRERQMAMLDAHAGASRESANYTAAYQSWRDLCQAHEDLANSERANEQEIDLLRHQIDEIETAEIQPEEADDLERRYRVASNGTHLMEAASAIMAALQSDGAADDGHSGSILGSLSDTARLIRDLEKHDPATAEFTGAFDTALVELEELLGNLRTYTEALEIDPSQLAVLESRLDLLESLKRKYGNSLPEVLEFQATAQDKLSRIEGRGEELERLSAAIAEASQKLEVAARKLSAKRKRGAPKLGSEVAAHLTELGFKHAHFEIALETQEKPTAHGAEDVEFMFCPNPGEPPKPLRQIASSGEMSRVMLAAKSALAREDSIPLLVFDEIDANVGGEIARAVGAKMASLGTSHQVISITHLPQVASLASCHYVVCKEFGDDGRTRSLLQEVSGEHRIDEIARMLGGSEKSARKHAQSLIEGENGESVPSSGPTKSGPTKSGATKSAKNSKGTKPPKAAPAKSKRRTAA